PWEPISILDTLSLRTQFPPSSPHGLTIGGWEWERHSQPWQVAVYHYVRAVRGGVVSMCKHMPCVPLLAHLCFLPSKSKVRLGQHSLDDDGDTGQSLRMPTFLSPDADNSQDLMLLQLREPANTTEAVRVTEEPTEEAKLGSRCLASGWGSTRPDKSLSAKILQCVDLTLMASDVCTYAYSQRVTEFMLCAGHQEGREAPCSLGDSGTTLLCDRMLQGITSWGGNPCAYPKKPSIFTKVSKHMSWIKANLQITP
uniref:Peptidase S1 domain-containing protein n=1 Tax=Rattus norvegicus TaxID=10116 RepID=A0A8I5ZXK8_RAT